VTLAERFTVTAWSEVSTTPGSGNPDNDKFLGLTTHLLGRACSLASCLVGNWTGEMSCEVPQVTNVEIYEKEGL